jgi:large subunit ribosomal protein L21
LSGLNDAAGGGRGDSEKKTPVRAGELRGEGAQKIMSYAVIRTGGKQYRVSAGENLRVEKLDVAKGEEVEFDDVLLIKRDGKLLTSGEELKGLKVKAKVVRHGRGTKLRVFTFRRRKGFEKRKGHRQDFTEVLISAIP